MTKIQELEQRQEWIDYQAPFYLERQYVLELAEYLGIDNPEEAEAKLDEVHIGEFESLSELGKHIFEKYGNYEDDVLQIVKKHFGDVYRYVEVNYTKFAKDLLLDGKISVLHDRGDLPYYIWNG